MQLVETHTDDHGCVTFVFTLITVVFVPLSFVADLFGMNPNGIEGNNVYLFCSMVVPMAPSLVFLCSAYILWGEHTESVIANHPGRFSRL